MTANKKRKQQAKTLRTFRKVHRFTGASLFFLFVFISVTGLLLGWKKHSSGIIQPESYNGTSTELADWLHIDSLHSIACMILHDSISSDLSLGLDRIDLRKDKGMVNFIFEDQNWSIQLDGSTGELLHMQRRWSDLIENIHDGSILDDYLRTSNEQIKVIYTSLTGLALLLFTITGFWLWYGPKRMRKLASKRENISDM
jgi:uncharacterized iron-regulated membrane protein